MLEIRLALTWKDFATLVRGECLTHKDKEVPIMIKIVLSDVGFDVMHALIERAKATRGNNN